MMWRLIGACGVAFAVFRACAEIAPVRELLTAVSAAAGNAPVRELIAGVAHVGELVGGLAEA
jgi:hypothetical protein